MTEDERAIRGIVERWFAATRAGNSDAILNLMSDDVIFMTPGGKPFGKEAFTVASQAMKELRFDGSYDIQEVRVFGDWAYMRNYLDVTITPPRGASQRRAGHTLTIYRKDADGQWRLTRDANLVVAVKEA